MKKLLTALLVSAPLTVLAAPITGVIAFVGQVTDNVDSVSGDGSIDFYNVIQWDTARTGDFAALTGSFFNVAFGPMAVTGNAIDLPVNPVWNINDGFGVSTSFILDTVSLYTNDSSGIAIEGYGDLSLTGFDTTRAQFSLDTANNKLTFDADATKVAGPATGALLGLGLIALGWSRRKA